MLRMIFWMLVAATVLAPLPFGAIYPWSYTLLAVLVGGLVTLWSATIALSGRAPAVTFGMILTPALLFGAVLAWAWVQAAPWTPPAWHNPIWAETARVLGQPVAGSISVDPHATKTGIMRLLTYAGVFWLALQYGRSSARARQVFQVVAVAGLAYAAYGLAVEFTGAEKILWFDKERYAESLTSTFRYKNAYATFAGFGLLCTLALLVQAIGQTDYATMGPRERARTILTLLFERVWYLGIGLVVILSALMLSNSRGGVLATLVAVGGFALCLRLSQAVRIPFGRTFTGVLLALGIVYFALSGGAVIDRIAQTSDADIRTSVYHYTLQAIGERPIVGWGLGTFEGVFASVQGPEFGTRTYRAHNEYLDNALGLGIPATAALVLAIAWIGVRCARGVWQRQRGQVYPATGFAAVLLAGTQSAVDFTLQEPAVAVTFALILGTACAQSWSSLVRRVASPDD